MIDRKEFLETWQSLCRRWKREPDSGEALEVLAFLDPFLTTEEFREAARHVWATREFFPRPADFVTATARIEWTDALRAKAGSEGRFPWRDGFEALSERGKEAVRAVGGLDTLVTLYSRDPFRARDEFCDAYELHAGRLAREHARLEAPKERRHRIGGGAESSERRVLT